MVSKEMRHLERDKYGRWKPSGIWVVTFGQDGRWHCGDGYSWESANREAALLMMKHPILRDITTARIVSDSRIGFGIPRMESTEYIGYSTTRVTPIQCFVIEAPTRDKALKLAKSNYNKKTIE